MGHAQNVSLTIDAGLLENALGTSAVPTGGLLQLIASPSGTFSAPTSSSYVAGDNVLVASFAMNYTSGTTGETFNSLNSLPLVNSTYATFGTGTNTYSAGVYTITSSEPVELRFYYSLTYASGTNYDTTAPTLATTFGQVRSGTLEGGDPTEAIWVVPASGTSVSLDYNTVSDSGPYANTTAYAANIVLAGVSVPEPSTYAMFAVGLIGLLAWASRIEPCPVA